MADFHDFPKITPTRRVFTPGTFPQKEFQGLNGAVTTLQYGARVVDSKLEMTFQNITDAQAKAILDNYEAANGGRDSVGRQDWVTLPAENRDAMAGVEDTGLREEMANRQSGPRLRYRYASPPVVTSTFPGRSTVQVILRGFMEGAASI